jgi:hypothetical protein
MSVKILPIRHVNSSLDPRLSRFRQWLPVQRTWTPQDSVSADEMNQNVRDSVNFLLSPPRCYLQSLNGIPVPNFATSGQGCTKFTFDTLVTDTDDMFSTNLASQINIRTPGLYKYKLMASWNVNNVSGAYMLGVASKSSGVWPINPTAGLKIAEDDRAVINSTGVGTASFIEGYYVSPGVDDYLEAFATCTSNSTSVSISSGYFQVRCVAQS